MEYITLKDTHVLLPLLLILYLTEISFENTLLCEAFQLKREHLDLRLKEHAIHETTTDHHNCARFCYYLTACKSFDHDRRTNVCKLNDADSTTVEASEFETKEHSIFSDITEWPPEIAGTCESRPCGSKQRCVPSFPPRCIDLECGPPWTENGLATLLDSTYTTYMAKAIVTCNEGYETNTLYITCQADETWSDGNCAKISCGALPSKPNGVATLSQPGATLYLDTATLACEYGYTATPPMFKCLSTKSWEHSYCACMPSTRYQGTNNRTVSGYTCQRWDTQVPHFHLYTTAEYFPDETVSAANNYCRSPGHNYLFCYTTATIRFEACSKPSYVC